MDNALIDIVRPWKEISKTSRKDLVLAYRDTQKLSVGRELQAINKVDYPLVWAVHEICTHEIATQAIRFYPLNEYRSEYMPLVHTEATSCNIYQSTQDFSREL